MSSPTPVPAGNQRGGSRLTTYLLRVGLNQGPIEPPLGRQIVGSGPHLTLATTEPSLVQTREEPLLEA
jgi:hypothetical protein